MSQLPAKRVLVMGGSGLLGSELVNQFRRYGNLVHAPSRTETPLTSPAALRIALKEFEPHVVVNAAAYTDVDGAEHDQETARRINTDAVEALSHLCRDLEIRFIQTSTASVFAGTPNEVFGVHSQICPVNEYNTTKAQAEKFCADALESGASVAWVRTYWLYGPRKRSFVDSVAERLLNGQQVRVVSDQWGQPTYAPDLAARIREIADDRSLVGPFHVVNSGIASRLDWATAIAELLNLETDLIVPVRASEFGAPAERPIACILEDSSEAAGLAPLRPWREALAEYLAVGYS